MQSGWIELKNLARLQRAGSVTSDLVALYVEMVCAMPLLPFFPTPTSSYIYIFELHHTRLIIFYISAILELLLWRFSAQMSQIITDAHLELNLVSSFCALKRVSVN